MQIYRELQLKCIFCFLTAIYYSLASTFILSVQKLRNNHKLNLVNVQCYSQQVLLVTFEAVISFFYPHTDLARGEKWPQFLTHSCTHASHTQETHVIVHICSCLHANKQSQSKEYIVTACT